jgi:DNA helicase-2/ATP-dependent DNA helicase PcrA
MELNAAQKQAVGIHNGSLLILAGPGTGKTRVLIQKMIGLVDYGVKPDKILAITFSKRATQEMEERLLHSRPDLADKISISTIHALCLDLVQRHGFRLGLSQKPQLMSESQSKLLFRQLIPHLPADFFLKSSNVDAALKPLFEFFEACKNESLWPEDILRFAETIPEAESEKRQEWSALGELYSAFQSKCFERGYIDFGDAILLAQRLLEDHKQVREEIQAEWSAILVDEFQDTNWAQIRLIRLMASPNTHVCAVGDDDQSIYKFRGASFSAFQFFEQMFNPIQVVELTETYRLSPEVLQVATALIQANGKNRFRPDKRIESFAASSGPVQVLECSSFESEAKEIVDRIENLLRAKVHPSQIGVLIRSHSHGALITQEAQQRGIPIQSLQTESLMDHELIRDVLAVFQLLKDPADQIALLRLLDSPFVGLAAPDVYSMIRWLSGRKMTFVDALSKASEWASEQAQSSIKNVDETLRELTAHSARLPASEILYQWIERTNIVQRLMKSDIPQLKKLAQFHSQLFEWEIAQPRKDLQTLLPLLESIFRHDIQLAGEGLERDPDCVSLMTMHASKGLEFDHVFIPSLVGRRVPGNFHKPTWILPEGLRKETPVDKEIHLQEERRLLYVGITRARKTLTLTTINKKGTNPSTFLKANILGRISDETILRWNTLPLRTDDSIVSIKPKKPFSRQQEGSDPSPSKTGPLSLSFTELDKFEKCPQAYWFQYQLGIPPRHSPTKSLGIAIHSALEKFFGQVKLGTTPSEEDLLKSFAEIFDLLQKEDPTLGEEHRGIGSRQLKTFYETSKGHFERPLAIEVPFSFTIGAHRIRGKIDRVDGSETSARIVDYKTGKSKDADSEKGQDFAENSLQFSIYALAAKECFGWTVENLSFYYLADGTFLKTTRSQEKLDETKNHVLKLAENIGSGPFEPTPNMVNCQYCDYARLCPSSLSRKER